MLSRVRYVIWNLHMHMHEFTMDIIKCDPYSFKYACNRPMSFCWLQPALAGTPAETPGPSIATGTRGIVWTASVTAQETNSRKTASIYSLFYNKVLNIISYSSILIEKKNDKRNQKNYKKSVACPHRGAKLKLDTVVKDNYLV